MTTTSSASPRAPSPMTTSVSIGSAVGGSDGRKRGEESTEQPTKRLIRKDNQGQISMQGGLPVAGSVAAASVAGGLLAASLAGDPSLAGEVFLAGGSSLAGEVSPAGAPPLPEISP